MGMKELQRFEIVMWCVDSRIVHEVFPTLKNDHSDLLRWEGEEQTKQMYKFIMWTKDEFRKFKGTEECYSESVALIQEEIVGLLPPDTEEIDILQKEMEIRNMQAMFQSCS